MKHILPSLLMIALVGSAHVEAQSSAWNYSTKSAIDGKITEFAMADSSSAETPSDEPTIVIRCSKTCEVYLTIRSEILADQNILRVKFNSSRLLKFTVSRGEADDSLFFREPWKILRAIRDNGGFMTVEYSPYEKIGTTATFGIWNLPPSILKRIPKQ